MDPAYIVLGILIIWMFGALFMTPPVVWRVVTSITVAVLALYVITLAERPY